MMGDFNAKVGKGREEKHEMKVLQRKLNEFNVHKKVKEVQKENNGSTYK